MLILTRRPKQDIYIGDDIIVKILTINPWSVKIGIIAPDNIQVWREEIYNIIKNEERELIEWQMK